MDKQYDVVVIGAGSGGLTAAVGFSKVGKKVLLVEREHMGGECTNTGCVPSKALLHHAKAYHAATKINGATTTGETYRKDAFTYVRNTIDAILAEETPETFKQIGIDVVMGEAVFTSKCAVTVNETTYGYKTAIIATGSSPRMLDIPGLDNDQVLTNQNIFTLDDVPEKLLVIGGGPIGMEMAQAFAMLGSQVIIAERSDTFARLEDEAVRPYITQSFTDLGITIKTNAMIEKVEGKTAHFSLMQGEEKIDSFTVEFDQVLMAIGRVPNIPSGLENAGITANQHCVLVDSQHRTSNKHVYAVGDVAQRLKFTHTADDMARQVVARVASKGLLRVKKNKAVPKVTYISPEVAQVGISWPDAIKKYGEDRLMRIAVPLTHNDRAKTDSATNGVLVVIARRINGSILGAHIVGPAAGEILSIFTLAIDHKISLWKLQKMIYAYPTYALIVKKAADQFVGRQLGELKTDVKKGFKRQAPKLLAGVLWIGALWALYTYQTNSGFTTTQLSVQLFEFLTMTAWGPLLYILIYAIRPVTFFPATALTILAGIFYGFVWGTALTLVAATLAAAVSYVVGRFFSTGIDLEHTPIGSLVETLRSHTFTGTLAARLSFLPFDLVSYAAGIIRISFIPYIIATFIGIILGTATFVSVGASLDLESFIKEGFSLSIINTEFLVLSAVVFIASLFTSKLFKREKASM